MRRALALGLVAAAACGSGASGRQGPDAGPPPDGRPDAPPPSWPACDEFGGPTMLVPVHVTSTLAGADVVAPAACDVDDGAFGTQSAGIDRVVPIAGLTPGKAYVVHVHSESDLAFYVATGCSSATGPTADQCELFEDATQGPDEVGRFVAGTTSAFVIVDYYASLAPPDVDFTLDVYPEQCQDAAGCGGDTPACYRGQCVACVTSFDCADPASPRCADDQTCQPGVDACTGDDDGEPANDGPAGAMVIAMSSDHGSVQGLICASPSDEADYLAFDVASVGEAWTFGLAWTGGADLDLEAFAADGTRLGMSYWERPEQIALTYLPVGRYYLRVTEFSTSLDPVAVPYTLSAQRTLGAGCAASADCAATYRNQLYRGTCSAGACVALDGGGGVAEGGACDSQSDCGLGLHCPSFYFVAHADTRDVCARACLDDTGCAPLGDVCTTYLATNFCVAKCTSDDECPTAIGSPPATGPWMRLSCDRPSGHCVP